MPHGPEQHIFHNQLSKLYYHNRQLSCMAPILGHLRIVSTLLYICAIMYKILYLHPDIHNVIIIHSFNTKHCLVFSSWNIKVGQKINEINDQLEERSTIMSCRNLHNAKKLHAAERKAWLNKILQQFRAYYHSILISLFKAAACTSLVKICALNMWYRRKNKMT